MKIRLHAKGNYFETIKTFDGLVSLFTHVLLREKDFNLSNPEKAQDFLDERCSFNNEHDHQYSPGALYTALGKAREEAHRVRAYWKDKKNPETLAKKASLEKEISEYTEFFESIGLVCSVEEGDGHYILSHGHHIYLRSKDSAEHSFCIRERELSTAICCLLSRWYEKYVKPSIPTLKSA